MKRLLLFLCFVPVICFGQYRADRARTNPNVTDGNGYCFRGHTATAVSAYCPEALALFARMTTPPSETRKGQINTLITSLKAAGVWTKLDVLYVFAAADQQAALLNWKGDTNNATAVNSPSFVADSGFKGNGSSSWVNTHYNPYVDSINFSLTSAHISIYTVTGLSAASQYDLGGREYTGTKGYSSTMINSADASKRIVGAICIDANYAGYYTVTSSLGLTAIDRESGSLKYYKNGSYVNSNTTAMKYTPSVEFGVCAQNINSSGTLSRGNYSTRRIAQAAIGGALSATEETAFSAATEVYMDAVGCGVIP